MGNALAAPHAAARHNLSETTMQSFVRKAVLGLMVTSILAAASSAFADNTYVEQNGTAGQNVVFKDDPLAAGGLGPNDVILKTRPSAVRMVLVRPRTQFVSEMLKSVENL